LASTQGKHFTNSKELHYKRWSAGTMHEAFVLRKVEVRQLGNYFDKSMLKITRVKQRDK
jgi:hypothetical protein